MQIIAPTINGIIQNTELIIKYNNKIQFITCDQLNQVANISDEEERKSIFTRYQILSNKDFINIIDAKYEYIESDIYYIRLNNGKDIYLTDYCQLSNKDIINLQVNDTVTMAYISNSISNDIHTMEYIDILELLNINSLYKNNISIKNKHTNINIENYDNIDKNNLMISLDNEYFLPAMLPLSSVLGKLLGYIYNAKNDFITIDESISKAIQSYLKQVFNIANINTQFFDEKYIKKYSVSIHNSLVLFLFKSLIKNNKFIKYIRFANDNFIKNFLIGQIDNQLTCKFMTTWNDIKQSIQEISLYTESEQYVKALIDLLAFYNIYGDLNIESYKDNNFLPNNSEFISYSFYLNKNNINLLQELVNYKTNKLKRMRVVNSQLFKSYIAEIKQCFYKGYIYNIQTESNTFAANNIIVNTI